MESGREQNYWPGFVDALSNVVLTLVFVLVIFVFALAMASNKVEKRMQEVEQSQKAKKSMEETTDQQKQVTSKQIVELRQELAAAKEQVERLSRELAASASDKLENGSLQTNAVADQNDDKHISIEEKAQNKLHQGAIDITHQSNTVVLGYPLEIAEMDDKSTAQLGHVLEAMEKTAGKHKILIRSVMGRESYSASRRLAYYRAIGARNYLLKAGENPSNITMTIVQPPTPEDGRVEIIFQK